MDVNSELAARATLYIELLNELRFERRHESNFPATLAALGRQLTAQPAHYQSGGVYSPSMQLLLRAGKLLTDWHPLNPADPAPAPNDPGAAWQQFVAQADAVLQELSSWQPLPTERGPAVGNLLQQAHGPGHPDWTPPSRWRAQLRRHLYEQPARRLTLARALQFVPHLLRELECTLAEQSPQPPTASILAQRERWLTDPAALAQELAATNTAVPFAQVFSQELADVVRRRTGQLQPNTPSLSPWDNARDLKLVGLGLSGGGIRSASFNLGVLQALATGGWLTRLDYLSTVSGGGYIGAWLVAWMKRLGSAAQVQQLLCPHQAPNPRSEENRPVRWLRSYSNYLAPNASAFSADMWTVGVTWLRNMLLNQVVLALALGAVLLLPYLLLLGWQAPWQGFPALVRYGLLGLALLVGGGVIGRMLYDYHRRRWGTGRGTTSTVLLTSSLLLAGYLASSYVAARTDALLTPANTLTEQGLELALGVGGLLTLALAAVAWAGRYDTYFAKPNPLARGLNRWLAWKGMWYFRLAVSTVLSAGLGTGLLWGAASLMRRLRHLPETFALLPAAVRLPVPADVQSAVQVVYTLPGGAGSGVGPLAVLVEPWLALTFLLGPVLMVEALALMVVLRMGLLGRHVPDDRREWWGRLGALVQLLLLGWLLLGGMALLGPWLWDQLGQLPQASLAVPVTFGGWLLLVGKGVQWAFSALTPAQPGEAVAKESGWRNTVAKVAPYLFALGLLVLLSWGGAALLERLHEQWYGRAGGPLTLGPVLLLTVGAALLAVGLAYCLGVNEFSMHYFYRNRLVRAYLGGSQLLDVREPSPFTGFDVRDDLPLAAFQFPPGPTSAPSHKDDQDDKIYDGPQPIFNTTLNVSRGHDLANQDRKAESFVFTPRYCGFDFARLRPIFEPGRAGEYAFRPTRAYAYPGGPSLGTAMTISGAAASPNSGYHSSAVTSFLLTIFNARLGWWMGNPRGSHWHRSDPRRGLFYLLGDLFGNATADDRYVNLSDGGHFDNLGLYELVRRRCRCIILADAEQDPHLRFEGLANAIRRCRIDFGAEVDLDVTAIAHPDTQGHSRAHAAWGRIRYPDWPAGEFGYVLYLKASLTGNEPADVQHYAAENCSFPHQTTGDQFFTEPQLESYRCLGFHIAQQHLQALPDNTTTTEFFRHQAEDPVPGPPPHPGPRRVPLAGRGGRGRRVRF